MYSIYIYIYIYIFLRIRLLLLLTVIVHYLPRDITLLLHSITYIMSRRIYVYVCTGTLQKSRNARHPRHRVFHIYLLLAPPPRTHTRTPAEPTRERTHKCVRRVVLAAVGCFPSKDTVGPCFTQLGPTSTMLEISPRSRTEKEQFDRTTNAIDQFFLHPRFRTDF